MIENNVTSLELSKKLAQIGVKQESLFTWGRQSGFSKYGIELTPCYDEHKRIGRYYYSAFLTSELLSILKAFVTISKTADSDEISVYYQPENGTDNSYTFAGTNLANLLANVIIAQNREGELK